MIKLRDDVVRTLLDDGLTAIMDVESLHARLKRSWRAAGYPDDSLAEDVALSVELALSDSKRGAAFTPGEIDAFVLKVLREAGLTEVAEHFGLDSSPVDSMVPVGFKEISNIISKFMKLDENQMNKLADDVLNAANEMDAATASPTLLLELARHFHSRDAKSADLPAPRPRGNARRSGSAVWLVSKEKIFGLVNLDTRGLLSSEMLKVGGVSALFPSIKLEFDPARFADSLDLAPPVPEFALLPRMAAVADAVNDIVSTIDASTANPADVSGERAPVHLKILNPDVFTEVWLGGRWPVSRPCVVELFETLSESFIREIRLHT
ncbi:MAG: hypothetical protein GXP32_01585 [Kiritimatiellaeota bacterium]|nr:hypothetical protein [Kiritimatiellota bacterium]